MFAIKIISFTLAFSGLVGCSAIKVETGFDEVSDLIVERGGKRTLSPDRADARTALNLKNPISLNQALRIALANSPNLQAQYARLAISRADVFQASLLRNPTFDASVAAGITGDPTRFALGAVVPFLDLVYRKSRTKAARAEFKATQIEVAESVMEYADEVASAYLDLAQSSARLEARQEVASVAQSQLQALERLVAAGTIDGSEFAELQVTSSMAEIQSNAERGERDAAQTRLAGLIGTPLENKLATSFELENIDIYSANFEALSEQAHRQRLDLFRAKQDIQLKKLSLKKARRLFNEDSSEIGLEFEDEDDERFLGPSVSAEVPVFDRGEIRRIKAEAELIEAERKFRAMEHSIDADVRVAHQRVSARSATALSYQNTLIPSILSQGRLTLERFNAGIIDVTEFLDSQRAVSDAKLEAIDAAAAYWEARIELAQAIGGWPSHLNSEHTRRQ